MKFITIFFHLIIVVLLTIATQIGGVVWCISLVILLMLKSQNKKLIQFSTFALLYLIFTFLIVPPLAQQFGRTQLPIHKSGNLVPHTYLTVLFNRHYVTPNLRFEMNEISDQFAQVNPTLKIVYLDANFPFFDGFPLLPHLSHNDGKKIDLSFIYSKNGVPTNDKPSNSGYGYYEQPKDNEYNKSENCLKKGYWQYDFPKYLTLGSSNHLSFETNKTKELLEIILKRDNTQKVFLEPHLKSRMRISHDKLRFHGCQSVRHDDHIHLQIN